MNHGINFFLSISQDFSWLGNWLFLLLAFVECVPFAGAFFPGGTLISIGAFFAAQGYFNVWAILVFSIVGAIFGDYMGYSLGRWGRSWLNKKNIIKPKLLEKGDKFFHKYGGMGLLWGRFVGATRAIVPFSAGTAHMKHRTFLFWNVLGAIVWGFFNVGIGYFSGNIISLVIHKWSGHFGLIILIIVIILLIYWIIRKHGQNLWSGFKKESSLFMDKVLSGRWYTALDKRYPVISELTKTSRKQEKVFGFLLITLILILLYIIALML